MGRSALIGGELEQAQVSIRVAVDQLCLLCVCEIYGAHAEELSAVVCDVVYERHYLLSLVVVALNRVVVHRHDQQAALLPHLQYVGVVDRVGEHGLVREAVDEELVIQRDEQVFLFAAAR